MTNPTPVDELIAESAGGVRVLPPERSIEVTAPKWAVHGQSADHLGARVLAAAVLAGIAVWLAVAPLVDALPGENISIEQTEQLSAAASTAVDTATARQQSAALAQADAEDIQRIALQDKRRAVKAVAGARRALLQARPDGQGRRLASEDLRAARVSRADATQRANAAKQTIRRAIDDWNQAAAGQDAAQDTLVASLSPQSTDADRVRVLALGGVALLSLLSAVALLAPRAEAALSYTLRRGPPPTEAKTADSPATTRAPATASKPGTAPKSSFVAREPVVTQAGLTAAALIAGLFGIQVTEGTTEAIINVLLPVLPIVGGFLARRQVWATANLAAKPPGT